MADYPTRFDRDDLLKCARGELFGPGNAQLPLPPMLMADRITNISEDGGEFGKGHIEAEFDIDPDLWFFGFGGSAQRFIDDLHRVQHLGVQGKRYARMEQ